MNDVLGKEITVGCKVVYPDRRGSSMWLNVAEVVGMDTEKRTLRVRRIDSQRDGTVSCLDRVAVVA